MLKFYSKFLAISMQLMRFKSWKKTIKPLKFLFKSQSIYYDMRLVLTKILFQNQLSAMKICRELLMQIKIKIQKIQQMSPCLFKTLWINMNKSNKSLMNLRRKKKMKRLFNKRPIEQVLKQEVQRNMKILNFQKQVQKSSNKC